MRDKTPDPAPDKPQLDGFTAPYSPLAQEQQRGLGGQNPPINWRDIGKFGENIAQLMKRFTPRGLLPRALLIFVVPVLILQGTIAFIFYDRHWDTVTSRLGYIVAGDIAAVIDLYNQRKLDGMTEANRESLKDFSAAHFGLIMSINYDATLPDNARGPLAVFDAHHRIVGKELRQRLPYPLWVDLYAFPEQADIRVMLPDDLSEPGTGTVLRFLVPIKRISTPTATVLLLWVMGLTVLLSLVAILFLRNQVRPIKQLADAADKFGRGLDPVGFKPSGATEVRTASRAFIRMKQRIERQINQRTDMLAGISHDLKTPLTRLRLELAMLPKSEAVDHMRSDLKDMEGMLRDYLEFARGQADSAAEPTNLATLLDELIKRLAATGKPVSLTIKPEAADGFLNLRPLHIRRSVENLINNGCRYGDKVEVTLARLPHHLEITVDDNGPGIPETLYEEALKPFSRLDEGRNQDADNVGSGLGLAIARDMARAHGGDLILNRSALGGLSATIRLPVDSQTPPAPQSTQ